MLVGLLRIKASYYSFLSGVFVALSVNIYTGVFSGDFMPHRWPMLLLGSFLTFISSGCWMIVSWRIEPIQKLALYESPKDIQPENALRALISGKEIGFWTLLIVGLFSAIWGLAVLALGASTQQTEQNDVSKDTAITLSEPLPKPDTQSDEPEQGPPSITTTPPYDFITIVKSSRPLTPNGTGNACWFKLPNGGPAELIFNEAAQITYATLTGGDDRFFFVAKKGDQISNVTGATIRPMAYVKLKFGNLHALKNHEIEFHNGRVDGGWEICLRDVNDRYKPLTF